jgi:membrane protein implicated in regulation of membrane protease activity
MDAWLIWLIAAGVLAAAETTSLTFYLLMASGGAAAGSITAGLGAPVGVQFLVAVVATLALVWLVRPIAIRHLNSGATAITGSASLVGEHAVVLSTVTGAGGRVRLNGGEWSARAKDPKQTLDVGTRVTVLGIDGATAVVWQDPLDVEGIV